MILLLMFRHSRSLDFCCHEPNFETFRMPNPATSFIERIPCDLTEKDFTDRFISTGVPVILQGCKFADSLKAFDTSLAKVVQVQLFNCIIFIPPTLQQTIIFPFSLQAFHGNESLTTIEDYDQLKETAQNPRSFTHKRTPNDTPELDDIAIEVHTLSETRNSFESITPFRQGPRLRSR